MSGTHYFEQMNEDTSDEIFSDKQSFAGLYKRLFAYSVTWFFIFLAIFFGHGMPDKIASALQHPKRLYLTPGIWEMHGTRFMSAFLLETPFVLLRNLYSLIVLAFLAIFAFCSFKAKRKEKALMKNMIDETVEDGV